MFLWHRKKKQQSPSYPTVRDKAREYCRRIAQSEEHYERLLMSVWVGPDGDRPCKYPHLNCEDCELNKFRGFVT